MIRWLISLRRAKIKTLAKRSIETGEDCDNIPDSMRRYLAMQAMEMGKGLGTTYLGRSGSGPYSAYGSGSMVLPENGNGKVGKCWLPLFGETEKCSDCMQ